MKVSTEYAFGRHLSSGLLACDCNFFKELNNKSVSYHLIVTEIDFQNIFVAFLINRDRMFESKPPDITES